MKRKIITINEDLCNGCGVCVNSCAEGALVIIDGKAKLVREDYCDGLGACLGHCPTGALVIEEKDAAPFDEEEVKKNIERQKQKSPVVEAHQGHGHHHHHGGCPGTMMRNLASNNQEQKTAINTNGLPDQINLSELRQWPVQLHLVNPANPAFKNKEMVLLSTCSPLASADVHWRYIRGRSVCVACPKLDDTSPYVDKLAEMLAEESIPKIIVLIMEVPCCRGLSALAKEAVKLSGRKDLILEEHIMSLEGKLKSSKQVSF